MTTLQSQTITQKVLSVDDARAADLIDGRIWTEAMATQQPSANIYCYSFDGISGGCSWGTPATFDSLVEFQEAANETAREIWLELHSEILSYR